MNGTQLRAALSECTPVFGILVVSPSSRWVATSGGLGRGFVSIAALRILVGLRDEQTTAMEAI
ncbi:MAG: hypothetical protein PF961_15435 [Planctomycetota bacterium]|jgi:hypothetical protein|nr:hypothetical protein [Planctomycetota bacterium]